MRRRGTGRRRIIIADNERAVGDLGQLPPTPPRDEARRERSIEEIDRDRVVDGAPQAGRSDEPTVGPIFAASAIWFLTGIFAD
jgi:hypothetical protein